MRIAVGQLAAGMEPAANRDSLARALDDAVAYRPDLVVLPEAAMCDLPAEPDQPARAEPLDGPFVGLLSALARRHGTAVLAGMFEQIGTAGDADGTTAAGEARPYNTLVLAGPDGSLLATYRKAHLYDAFGYRESDRIAPGPAQPVVAVVAGVRVGLLTCYDLRFPEQARALLDAGAQVLALPAAWVRGPYKEDHWATLVRARAIENTVYVAAAAQCGPRYCGRSMVVDPLGVVLAGLGEAPGVAVAQVDLERLAAVRRTNPALANRRWLVTTGDERAGGVPE